MAYISFQPSDFFNTKLYTGNTSANAVTGVGFAPALAWFKSRGSINSHALFCSPMGTYSVASSNTAAQLQQSGDGFTSLDSDGFTLNGNGGGGGTNSALNYVAWNWKAGTTSGISGGTITPSSYSINTTSKTGIYAWTGTATNGTIAHGLGATPSLIIVKRLNGIDNWAVFHRTLGGTKVLMLDTTGAQQTMADRWNSSGPDDTVFHLGTAGAVNGSGGTYIAYVFCDVPGYFSTGKYQGNASPTDGPFIPLDHKPGLFIAKRYDGIDGWYMFDNKRLGYNFDNNSLQANSTAATTTTDYGDILSNGFKIRNSAGDINTNGGNFVYMSWAAEPIVGSDETPGLAR